MASDLPEKINWDKAWVDCDNQSKEPEKQTHITYNSGMFCALSLICWFILSIMSGDFYLIACGVMTFAALCALGVNDGAEVCDEPSTPPVIKDENDFEI